jgi:hypothetical protein
MNPYLILHQVKVGEDNEEKRLRRRGLNPFHPQELLGIPTFTLPMHRLDAPEDYGLGTL